MKLRDYQINALENLREAYRRRRQSPLFVLPTGGGKTACLAEIAKAAADRGNRSCILVHRRELVQQTSAALDRIGVRHGVIAPGYPPQFSLMVQVASIQTLVKRLDLVGDFLFLFVDEAHHAPAGSYQKIIARWPKAKRLGVTATPCRMDGQPLNDIFDEIITGPSIFDLTDQGFLAPAKVYAPQTSVSFGNMHLSKGDFDSREAEGAMSSVVVIGDVIEHYRARAHNKPAIAFCVSVTHAKKVAEMFREAGYLSTSVDGADSPEHRSWAINALTTGEIHVLTSCAIISEGTDIPRATAAILLRPTMSLSLYLQQCLDSETQVLTDRGWMKRTDIRKEDRVAAWDYSNDKASWEPIAEITQRPLAPNEKMFGISAPHLDIRVTGGHDMLVRNRSQTSRRWQKELAEKTSLRKSMFEVPVSAFIDAFDEAPVTDHELSFLGWFLSDGTLNKINGSITISQSAAKDMHCDLIRNTLKMCGLKYVEHRIVRTGTYAGYSDLIQFYVSRGAPRGSGKHLRGWGHLAQWCDKTIPPCYDLLSPRQLTILLSAMFLGDGQNSAAGVSWKRSTFTLTCGDNEIMADRLQALLVTKGYRANKASTAPPTSQHWGAVKLQHHLHFSATRSVSVAGVNDQDGTILGKSYRRSRFSEVPSSRGEIVWCVSNRLGTIFTRRNGKVAILGNCGRVLRPVYAPGLPLGTDEERKAAIAASEKPHAIILDHVENVFRFGLHIDDRDWSLEQSQPRPRKDGRKSSELIECGPCGALVNPKMGVCTECGHPFPIKDRTIAEKRFVTINGNLVEIDATAPKTKNPLHQKVQQIGVARNYKPGWASMIMRDRVQNNYFEPIDVDYALSLPSKQLHRYLTGQELQWRRPA